MLLFWLIPTQGAANPDHCDPLSLNTSNPIDVYLNFETFEYLYNSNGVLGGLTLDESIGMLMQSLEEWNHSAAGRPFVYMGTTTEKDGSCGKAVVRAGEYSNGVFGPWVTSVLAQMRSRCNGASFTIVFSTMPPVSPLDPPVPWKWKTGDPSGPGVDMIAVTTHELGHASGIRHPVKCPSTGCNGTSAYSVMEKANTNRRELYQLDTECAEKYFDGAPRNLAASQMVFTGGSFPTSSIGSSFFWSLASGVSSGGTNSTPNRFRGVRMTDTGLYAEKYSFGLMWLNSATYHTAHPPTRVHRRDLPGMERDAIISKRRYATNYGDWRHEKFRHSIYYSTDGFDSMGYQTVLSHCTYALAGTCYSIAPVYSARRVAAGFDTVSNRTVYVWTDQNREDHAQNNELLIAFGHYDWFLTGKVFSAGVRSDVAPAVACKPGVAGSTGRDCMVAYTDIADSKNSVRFRRFDAAFDGTHFYPAFDSGFHTVDSAGWPRTASPIGLFHHHGKWWLAIKLALATGNGGVRVYSSTNGDTGTWTSHGSTGHTYMGASAIGDWTVSNYVRWTH